MVLYARPNEVGPLVEHVKFFNHIHELVANFREGRGVTHLAGKLLRMRKTFADILSVSLCEVWTGLKFRCRNFLSVSGFIDLLSRVLLTRLPDLKCYL
jgi:hypothetical protein